MEMWSWGACEIQTPQLSRFRRETHSLDCYLTHGFLSHALWILKDCAVTWLNFFKTPQEANKKCSDSFRSTLWLTSRYRHLQNQHYNTGNGIITHYLKIPVIYGMQNDRVRIASRRAGRRRWSNRSPVYWNGSWDRFGQNGLYCRRPVLQLWRRF